MRSKVVRAGYGILAAAGVVGIVTAVPAGSAPDAVDLAAIPRTVAKEPVYRSGAPRYCLLALGRAAKSRVWLVQDGGDLYVDRNRNGNLTEPGERVAGKDGVFQFGDLVEADGKSRYTAGELGLNRHYEISGGRTLDRPFEIKLSVRGQYQMMSSPAFSLKPAEAPVVHVGGPLTMRIFDPRLVERDQRVGFRAEIGTPGLGEGAQAMVLHAQLPEYVYPNVEFEFPMAGGAPPQKQRVELKARCCQRLFLGTVRVPADSAPGPVKVSLSFPDWKEGQVQPSQDAIEVR
jgi:hypothetical protein